MSSTTFSAVSAVVETAPGQFDATVDPLWTINRKPNGGYLLAMLGNAATAVGSHEHVIAASAHYLHSPDPGPVQVRAEVLRAGRSASQVRAGMSQGGKPCVEALLTVSTLDPNTSPYWDTGVPSVAIAAFEDCTRLPPISPANFPVPMMGEADVRIDPATLSFAAREPSGRGELRGWLALPMDEPFDPTALLFAVDAFPPATFDIELSGWVPTLELTAYVRALPAPGPLQVLQKAQLIDAQRVDEVCYVWDCTGRLVAHGTQLAGIRLG
ncbi:MAG: thioesterase family protein [Jatrophihabitantaceae bacterium]